MVCRWRLRWWLFSKKHFLSSFKILFSCFLLPQLNLWMIPWLDNIKPVVVKEQAYWHLEMMFYHQASLFLSLVTGTVKSPPSQPVLTLVFFIRPLPTKVIPSTFRSGGQCTQFVFIPPDRLMRNHQHKRFRDRKAWSVFLIHSFGFLFFSYFPKFFLCLIYFIFKSCSFADHQSVM